MQKTLEDKNGNKYQFLSCFVSFRGDLSIACVGPKGEILQFKAGDLKVLSDVKYVDPPMNNKHK